MFLWVFSAEAVTEVSPDLETFLRLDDVPELELVAAADAKSPRISKKAAAEARALVRQPDIASFFDR